MASSSSGEDERTPAKMALDGRGRLVVHELRVDEGAAKCAPASWRAASRGQEPRRTTACGLGRKWKPNKLVSSIWWWAHQALTCLDIFSSLARRPRRHRRRKERDWNANHHQQGDPMATNRLQKWEELVFIYSLQFGNTCCFGRNTNQTLKL
jgi:hypothetical protein